MAYGSWSSEQWTQTKSNGYYAVDLLWSYRQDVENNKTEIKMSQMRVRSLNGYYSYISYNNQYGWQFLSTGKIYDSRGTISCRGGGSATSPRNDITHEFTHNSSGAVTITVAVHWLVNLGGQNNVPEWDWYNINLPVPNIDRSGGTGTIVYNVISSDSVTINYRSDVVTTLIEYSLNGGVWIDTGKDITTANSSVEFTVDGLIPDSKNTVKVRHRRDSNGAYSNKSTISFTTNSPSKPTSGSIRITSSSMNSLSVSASGFSFSDGATFGQYEWMISTSQYVEAEYESSGRTASKTFTGLSPNTLYYIKCRLRDNYGSVSSTASTSGWTSSPSKPDAGYLSVSSKTTTSVTMRANDYSAVYPASISKYQWKLEDDYYWEDGSYTHTFSGLSPNTQYKVQFRILDSYGTYSDVVSYTVTTSAPNKPNAGYLLVVSKTSTTIKMMATDYTTQGGYVDKFQWKLSTSSYWTDGDYEHTFTGLTPDTTYTIQFRIRDNYGTYSDEVSEDVRTNAPDKPIAGDIDVYSATSTSIYVVASNFTFSGSSTIGRYEWAISTSPYNTGTFESSGTTPSKTFSNLSPETTYYISCRLRDNYGTYSDTVTIDYQTPSPGLPESGSISLTSSTATSLTFKASGYSAESPATIEEFQWKLSSDYYWTNGTNSHTFTNLNPNTQYTIYFRVVDNYGNESSYVSKSAYTNSPENPTITSFTADSITGNSITLHFDAEYGDDYPSDYESYGTFYIDRNMGNYWTQIAKLSYKTKQYNVTGLEEEKEYNFRIRLRDFYGNYSDYKFLDVTTLFVGKRCYIKIGNQAKQGIVYIKVGNEIKRATGMWIKKNGELKEV